MGFVKERHKSSQVRVSAEVWRLFSELVFQAEVQKVSVPCWQTRTELYDPHDVRKDARTSMLSVMFTTGCLLPSPTSRKAEIRSAVVFENQTRSRVIEGILHL